MAKFTVRIELHDTELSHPKYTDIHGAMLTHGFVRNFVGKGGELMLLPRAEYIGEALGTAETVAQEVYGWIRSIHSESMVTATMWGGFSAYGNIRYAPVAHVRGAAPSKAAYGQVPRATHWIRQTKAEAQEYARTSGGIVCPNCYKRS